MKRPENIIERIEQRFMDYKSNERCYTKTPGASRYTLKTIFSRKKKGR